MCIVANVGMAGMGRFRAIGISHILKMAVSQDES